MSDNLQAIVDDIRAQLATGASVYTRIELDGGLEPLWLEVIPDGVTWLVRLQHGDRTLHDAAAEPKAFVSNLYVWLRYAINEARGLGPKRVGAN